MNALRRFPHYAAFAGVMLPLLALLWPRTGLDIALLLAFDMAVLAFLATLGWRMRKATPALLRAAAAEPGHALLRIFALLIVAVVLTGVASELGRGGSGVLLLAGVSLSMAWLFANNLFALHYMHIFYGEGGGKGGLRFPEPADHPDFWDFCYFAFTIGMTFQVSDVEITSSSIRRLALAHGLLAFAFNIAVIALTVSLVASALA
ncbi:DUF1345 domain-containing protein [Sandarakinorhabdus rubra]|uniref:DUF1345 domain-containing protein n=1 Tax=Sandarakinorhabdus rubra TaxID=2672568 RepID=UPI0013DA9ABA|nr:DUF1345 domain-containing protein [Sandarakinorhabdus rubra]